MCSFNKKELAKQASEKACRSKLNTANALMENKEALQEDYAKSIKNIEINKAIRKLQENKLELKKEYGKINA